MRIGKFAKTIAAGALAAACLTSVAACGPGSSNGGSAAPAEEVSTDLGDETYELTLWDGAGLKSLDDALIAGFQEKYPNITITATYDPDNVTQQNGPRIISASDTYDIVRVTDIGSAVRGNHLVDLEDYADAYGWRIPDAQTTIYRVTDDGELGGGDLYAVPSGLSMTGMFWNKELGAQIGLTEAPKSMEELEAAMAKAADAGILPMMLPGKDGGASFPYQALMTNAGGADAVQSWILQNEGATFDTDAAVSAAETLQSWAESGYLPNDVNALDASTALGRFTAGEGLFFPSGNWNTATVSEAMGDKAGFFAFPGATESDPATAALNGATAFGIPANAKNKNAAAAFLDYLTSEEARQIVIDNSGYAPAGDGEMPVSDDALVTEMLSVYGGLMENGATTDFINNATAGIQSSTLIPNFQLLLDGSITPEEFPAAVQAAYDEELGK